MKEKRALMTLPVNAILPIAEWQKEYWQLVGRLIDAFTLVEEMINFVAVEYAGVTWREAKGIFLPLRVDAAGNLINRIIEAKKLRGPRIKEIQAIIEQLGVIGRARNDLVHMGPRNINGKERWVVSNERYLRSRKQPRRRFMLSAREFEKIDNDLHDILFRLMMHAKLARPSPHDDKFSRIIKSTIRFNYRQAKPAAWLYKSHKPASRRRKRRAHLPTRPHQPQSSGV